MVEHGQFRAIGTAESDQKPVAKPENSRLLKFKVVAKVLVPAVMLLAIASACETDAQNNPPFDHTPICDSTGRFFENELIVKSKSGEISEEVQKIFSDFEARVIREETRSVGGEGESVLVEVDPDKRDKLERILDGHPDVGYAEKSFVIEAQQNPCP